jgi:hypothetical protein
MSPDSIRRFSLKYAVKPAACWTFPDGAGKASGAQKRTRSSGKFGGFLRHWAITANLKARKTARKSALSYWFDAFFGTPKTRERQKICGEQPEQKWNAGLFRRMKRLGISGYGNSIFTVATDRY